MLFHALTLSALASVVLGQAPPACATNCLKIKVRSR